MVGEGAALLKPFMMFRILFCIPSVKGRREKVTTEKNIKLPACGLPRPPPSGSIRADLPPNAFALGNRSMSTISTSSKQLK